MTMLFYKAEVMKKTGKMGKSGKFPKSDEPCLNNLSMYKHCVLLKNYYCFFFYKIFSFYNNYT